MDLKHLRTFLVLCELKNFTKTAAYLNYAQSNVTTQIKQLEEHLQVKLFERIGKTVSLTAEGKELVPYAKKMLSLSQEAESIYKDTHTKKRIVIGASETLSIYLLPPILKKYRELYPDVEIFLQILEQEDFIQLLSDNTIDVAIALEVPYTDPCITKIMEEKTNLSLYSLPDHPLAAKSELIPADLSGESMLLTADGCCYRKFLEKDFLACGITPKILLETSSISAIKENALCGLGICFLPELVVKKEVQQGKLVPLHLSCDYPVFTQVFYHKDKWISPALDGFLKLLHE